MQYKLARLAQARQKPDSNSDLRLLNERALSMFHLDFWERLKAIEQFKKQNSVRKIRRNIVFFT